jgi:hypothetical protein
MKASQFLQPSSNPKSGNKQYVHGRPSEDAKVARDEFVAHRSAVKKARVDEKLTPLQKRMQSGGPA